MVHESCRHGPWVTIADALLFAVDREPATSSHILQQLSYANPIASHLAWNRRAFPICFPQPNATCRFLTEARKVLTAVHEA